MMTSFLFVNSQEKTFHYLGGGSLGFTNYKTVVVGTSGVYPNNSSTTLSGTRESLSTNFKLLIAYIYF